MLSLDGSYKPYLLKRLALGASLLPPLCTQRNPREIKQPQPQAASQFLQSQPGPAPHFSTPIPPRPGGSQLMLEDFVQL